MKGLICEEKQERAFIEIKNLEATLELMENNLEKALVSPGGISKSLFLDMTSAYSEDIKSIKNDLRKKQERYSNRYRSLFSGN